MAHYAIIDPSNNEVVQVIVGVDENVTQTDTDGTVVGGSTEAWESFYASLAWNSGKIVRRTSYNGNFRKNYAGIGYTWDAGRNAFIPPKPFASWLLNEDTCHWESPVAYPNDGGRYIWNEDGQTWDAVGE